MFTYDVKFPISLNCGGNLRRGQRPRRLHTFQNLLAYKQKISRFLIAKNLRLILKISSHRGIVVLMIRHEVSENGYVRTHLEISESLQLPGIKFKDDYFFCSNVGNLRKRRDSANVSTE